MFKYWDKRNGLAGMNRGKCRVRITRQEEGNKIRNHCNCWPLLETHGGSKDGGSACEINGTPTVG